LIFLRYWCKTLGFGFRLAKVRWGEGLGEARI